MPEAVRLLIWDLDDTFWQGTVTEGGITAYIQLHHDIVIALAHRGIVSSICSKNDAAVVWPILQARGIAEYFVFPSISWHPKGARLAALIDAVQLRPASVMFIDDNPGNRAEAQHEVPGLQVEDETFIATMLSDPRFAGKDDSGLTRLAQYRLLETRKRDEARASGDNATFLRGCDIRVRVEYDVLSHLDRAIELINRTNQLNFTKKRLPEDTAAARQVLAAQIDNYDCQAGLIHVIDKYGDYGLVGFYMIRQRRRKAAGGIAIPVLEHFCFSCRTLGMQVETWLYDWLGRPDLTIVDEALTDLSKPREIDWVRLISSTDQTVAAAEHVAPQIRLHGGCEANAIAHYLAAYTGKITVNGNFASGRMFVRVNGASLLLSAIDRKGEVFAREAEALGLPYDLLTSHYFDDVPAGTVFVFSGGLDAREGGGGRRYRHKIHGWELKLLPLGLPFLNLVAAPLDEVKRQLAGRNKLASDDDALLATVGHVRENYIDIPGPSEHDVASAMAALIDRVPLGCKFIMVLDDHRIRSDAGVLAPAPWVVAYNAEMALLTAPWQFIGVVSFTDYIADESEILVGGNHYNRTVYWRMAEAIIAEARRLPVKTPLNGFSGLPPRGEVGAPVSAERLQLLRARDIRITVEFNVLAHIDCVMELLTAGENINVTRRTKPADANNVKRTLLQQLHKFNCQAGLIQVQDAHRDYGLVGFYMVTSGRRDYVAGASWQSLVHYGFSGAVAGMFIAEWVYHWLGRPEIRTERRGRATLDMTIRVDWVRMVCAPADGATDHVPGLPALRVHGSSEAYAVAHYLRASCPDVTVTGSFEANRLMVRLNSALLLADACDRTGADFEREAQALGVPYELLIADYFNNAPEATLFVFSGNLDAAPKSRIYRHKEKGWLINIHPAGLPTLDIGSGTEDDIRREIGTIDGSTALRDSVLATMLHIHNNYKVIARLDNDALQRVMLSLFDLVPVGCKFIVVLDDERTRAADGSLRTLSWVAAYNAAIRTIATARPFVGVVSLAEAISGDDEIQIGGNHADPVVYLRLAHQIARLAHGLPCRGR